MRPLFAAVILGLSAIAAIGAEPSPLHLAVMDPLCKELACPCVKGFAQRDYKALAAFLSARLGRPVEFLACETLADADERTQHRLDLVIGKCSVIEYHAARLNTPVKPLAMLSGLDGATTLTGLFVVRSDAPVKKLTNLKGRTILFGDSDAAEKHAAALAALAAAGVPVPEKPETRQGCDGTVLEVFQKKADAGVISSYAIQLLEGCGTIDKGSLRIVGKTAPVPFIGVFATAHLPAKDAEAVRAALLEVGKDKALRAKLETRKGFVAVKSESPQKALAR